MHVRSCTKLFSPTMGTRRQTDRQSTDFIDLSIGTSRENDADDDCCAIIPSDRIRSHPYPPPVHSHPDASHEQTRMIHAPCPGVQSSGPTQPGSGKTREPPTLTTTESTEGNIAAHHGDPRHLRQAVPTSWLTAKQTNRQTQPRCRTNHRRALP